MTCKQTVAYALVLAGATCGGADTVFFKDGSSLDGVVTRDSRDEVVLQLPGGRMRFSAEDVDRVEENDLSGAPERPATSAEAGPDATSAPALPPADEQTLRDMLDELMTTDAAARTAVRARLVRYGTTHDVFPFLERALPYMTDRQGVEVLAALAELDPARAKPVLIATTASRLERNRAQSLHLLGQLQKKESSLDVLRLIARGTVDDSSAVRLAAIAAIETAGDKRATPILVEALKNPDRRVQAACLRALQGLWGDDGVYKDFTTPAHWQMMLSLAKDEIRETLDPATLTPLATPAAPGDEDYNLGVE